MQLKLKLYAGLEQFLPRDAQNNAVLIDINQEATVNSIIRQCNLPVDLAHLVLLNGNYVDPRQRDSLNVFKEGDTLAIWPPVAGG